MKKLPLFFIAITLSLVSFSQVYNPAKWGFSADEKESDIIILKFEVTIDDNWHLYGINIPEGGPIATSVTFNESENFELIGDINYRPKPNKKYDPTFDMELELFSHHVEFTQNIKRKTSTAFDVSGFVEYMACDDSRCLPPNEVDFNVRVDKKITKEASDKAVTERTKNELIAQASKPLIPIEKIDSNQMEISNALADSSATVVISDISDTSSQDAAESLLSVFLLALLGGLASLLTPCVYPIIPLTVSYFMRDTGNKTNAVYNGLAFGISIIAIYTLVGLLVGLLRIDLGRAISSHWLVNVIFFCLFLVFAFSFLGMFELMLPTSWANKIDQRADKGGLLGPFFMALATVIISFSCTGPIVGVLLGTAMQGELLIPVVGMFGFSLTFALPFTLLAIFPKWMKSLPKSGGWLNSVKVVFAFILLAFGLKFISNIDLAYHLNLLSRDVYLGIWVMLFILLGLYLLGKIKFSHDSDLPYVSIPRFLLAGTSFVFAIYLFTGVLGAQLKPIQSVIPPMDKQIFSLSGKTNEILAEPETNSLCGEPKYADFLHLPHNLQGYFDYEEALACGKQQNKPVLVDFVGHYCTNCKKMYADVWSDSRVLEKLKSDFIIVALYVDDKTKLPKEEWVTSERDGKIKNTIGKIYADFQIHKFGTNALPLYAVVDVDGNMVSPGVYTFSLNVQKFLNWLDKSKL